MLAPCFSKLFVEGFLQTNSIRSKAVVAGFLLLPVGLSLLVTDTSSVHGESVQDKSVTILTQEALVE